MTITTALIKNFDTEVFKAEGQQAITTITFCNVSNTSTVEVSLFAVPDGKITSPGTQVLNQVPLTPGESFSMDSERFVLESNDQFRAIASISDIVCVTVSSVATT